MKKNIKILIFVGIVFAFFASVYFVDATASAQCDPATDPSCVGPVAPSSITGGLVPCGPGTSKPECEVCDFFVLIDRLLDFAMFRLVPALAVILLTVGGGFYIFSGGSETRAKEGKTIITSALIGMAIVYGSWIILDTVLKQLTDVNEKFGPWNEIQCQ